MLARQITDLTILWFVLIARSRLTGVIGVEMAVCGGAVAVGGDRKVVNVIDWTCELLFEPRPWGLSLTEWATLSG